MSAFTTITRRVILRLALGAVLAALLFGVRASAPDAVAAPPQDTPVFSQPLEITNAVFPVIPGAVKVYSGRARGVPLMIVESHLLDTRTFPWAGGSVECRIIEELVFERGQYVASEQRYVAQADDGSVWTFGEVEDDDPHDDGGNDAKETGGWIVGQRAPSDPPDIATGAAPTMWMPSTPTVGDEWTAEEAPPSRLTLRSTTRTRATLRVPTGRYTDCVRIRETDVPDKSSEAFWHAPGLGIVKSRAGRERLSLQASTIRVAGRE